MKTPGPLGKPYLGFGSSRDLSTGRGLLVESSHVLARVVLLMTFGSSLKK